jgi:hypothetical protein
LVSAVAGRVVFRETTEDRRRRPEVSRGAPSPRQILTLTDETTGGRSIPPAPLCRTTTYEESVPAAVGAGEWELADPPRKGGDDDPDPPPAPHQTSMKSP